jgi:hypothetical protein
MGAMLLRRATDTVEPAPTIDQPRVLGSFGLVGSLEATPGVENIREDVSFAVRANKWIDATGVGPSSVRSKPVTVTPWGELDVSAFVESL